MIETFNQLLPHGITLGCRAAGERGRPVLMFLHGFPEGAFVWDELLLYFSRPENGAYRCVAPYLRGFGPSSAPSEVSAYRPKHLVQDIVALIAIETQSSSTSSSPLACLVAHDWGGAVAWNLANQAPHLMQQLAIINSPHPGTFLRALQFDPQQQAASAYMLDLIKPNAESWLAQDDFANLWDFLQPGHGDGGDSGDGGARQQQATWLTEELQTSYREVWRAGLTGGCNLYRASPLRPPTAQDPGAAALDLPHAMLSVHLPTLVLWGLQDSALRPVLLDGLEDFVKPLTVVRVADASHWIVHEQPALVMRLLADFLKRAQ
jgi:pimeloyl-ACP methyl ester carboxylesterase